MKNAWKNNPANINIIKQIWKLLILKNNNKKIENKNLCNFRSINPITVAILAQVKSPRIGTPLVNKKLLFAYIKANDSENRSLACGTEA